MSNCTKRIEWIGAIAAILTAMASLVMAVISGYTLHVNVVERNQVFVIQEKSRKLESELQQGQKRLADMQARLTNSINRVLLLQDVLSASAGSKKAYLRAYNALASKECVGNNELEFIASRIDFIANKFSEGLNDDSWDFGLTDCDNTVVRYGSNSRIERDLNSTFPEERIRAIRTIHVLRRNQFIPFLAELAINDDNLHVIQNAVFVARKALDACNNGSMDRNIFSTKMCILSPEVFKDYFSAVWEEDGKKALAAKPVDLVVGVSPNDNVVHAIELEDPNKPNPHSSIRTDKRNKGLKILVNPDEYKLLDGVYSD